MEYKTEVLELEGIWEITNKGKAKLRDQTGTLE